MFLPDAVNASDPLLNSHRVPREVEVEEHARELKVDSLPPRRCTDQDPRPIWPLEPPFGRKLCAVVATSKDRDSLARVGGVDLAPDELLIDATEGDGELTFTFIRGSLGSATFTSAMVGDSFFFDALFLIVTIFQEIPSIRC